MVATSSTCSLMNHCMNCSAAKSFTSRAVAVSSWICSVTRFSWATASSTGATTPSKSFVGSVMAGRRTGWSVSSRYWTIIFAWPLSSRAWR